MFKTLSSVSLAVVLSGTAIFAQTTIDQISAGAGYAKAGFYKLADGTSEQVAHDAWDIAFSNLGPQHAGVFVNESSATVMGQPMPSLELYDTYLTDFTETVNPSSLTADQRLFNPESSWSEGAFNTVKDPSNPFDLGWGTYNVATHKVVGNRVFALKLRNGQFRKIIIDEFSGSAYTFRIANLDGTGLETKTVSTAFGNGSPVVYFSLANGTNVPTPTNWDLVFCRYITPLWDGQGYLPYSVTGILSGQGVLAAKAVNVDPATVKHEDYLDSLSTRLDVVGHDWKAFNNGWSVAEDHVYFVKTRDSKLYKIVFLDFEGSSTGTGTFEKTLIGTFSSASDLPTGIREALVFPNPVAERLTLSFTSEVASDLSLRLTNIAGQQFWSSQTRAQNGLNVLEINDLPTLPAGNYVLTAQLPNGQFSRQITVGQ
ncbi:MAG: HmuY family protein [Saprospiraceae bacterium]